MNKLNVILVQILKHDWPARWRSFIPGGWVGQGASTYRLCGLDEAEGVLESHMLLLKAAQVTSICTKGPWLCKDCLTLHLPAQTLCLHPRRVRRCVRTA